MSSVWEENCMLLVYDIVLGLIDKFWTQSDPLQKKNEIILSLHVKLK